VIDLTENVEVLFADASTRVVNGMRNANIKTLGDLLAKTPHELLRIENFGRKSLNEVMECLAHRGLMLGTGVGIVDERHRTGCNLSAMDRRAGRRAQSLSARIMRA